jgi:prepilin-type N-terminal cleavage/methylation domain-containing protein
MGDKMSRDSGFSLVEVMVVTAIVAILATVAIPAYINYVNRMNQGDAVTILMNAKMDMEAFYENNYSSTLNSHYYAPNIGCLPSCNNNPACLNNCGACANTYQTGKDYVVRVVSADTQNFRIRAEKKIKIYSYRGTDILEMTATINQPIIVNTDALGFSLFKTLFD